MLKDLVDIVLSAPNDFRIISRPGVALGPMQPERPRLVPPPPPPSFVARAPGPPQALPEAGPVAAQRAGPPERQVMGPPPSRPRSALCPLSLPAHILAALTAVQRLWRFHDDASKMKDTQGDACMVW